MSAARFRPTRGHLRSRKGLLALLCCILTLQSLLGPLAMAATSTGEPYTPADFSQGDSNTFGFGTPSTSSRGWANGLATIDPSTGAARTSLPFELVRARGQVQPQLSINYDSSNGDREAGTGWALSLPMIERRSPAGLVRPLYIDPPVGQPIHNDIVVQDQFVYSGQPLVPICFIAGPDACQGSDGNVPLAVPAFAAGGGWHYYSLAIENGSTLRFFWSPDHRTWVVQDKMGSTTEFGVPQDGNYDSTNGIDNESQIVANDFGSQRLVPPAVPYLTHPLVS